MTIFINHTRIRTFRFTQCHAYIVITVPALIILLLGRRICQIDSYINYPRFQLHLCGICFQSLASPGCRQTYFLMTKPCWSYDVGRYQWHWIWMPRLECVVIPSLSSFLPVAWQTEGIWPGRTAWCATSELVPGLHSWQRQRARGSLSVIPCTQEATTGQQEALAGGIWLQMEGLVQNCQMMHSAPYGHPLFLLCSSIFWLACRMYN